MTQNWYWNKGLHDANILGFNENVLDYDYKKTNPTRNVLSLKIDSSHAIGDTSITEIKFYNYKIISELKNPQGIWWKEDLLETKGDKFILTIKGHKDDIFIIKFDKAEVVR